jgi:hypothetical protein
LALPDIISERKNIPHFNMPTRIKILSVVFLVLLALVIVQKFNFSSTALKEPENIAITDTSSIIKVTFTRPDSSSVLVEKMPNNEWQLNGKYVLRSYLKNLMFTGLTRMQVKREVSESMTANVISDLKTRGYKIQIEREAKQNDIQFYIGVNDNDPNSSLFLDLKQPDKPYIILVPGFEGSLSNLFALATSEWREKEIFTSTADNLQEVTVTYPGFSEMSFEIKYTKNGFAVSGIQNLDSLKLGNYLTNFQLLTINNFIEGGKEALQKDLGIKPPLAILKVENLHKTVELEIYERNGKVFGYIPAENEYVGLRTEVYSRLLVKRDYFIKNIAH